MYQFILVCYKHIIFWSYDLSLVSLQFVDVLSCKVCFKFALLCFDFSLGTVIVDHEAAIPFYLRTLFRLYQLLNSFFDLDVEAMIASAIISSHVYYI